MSPLHTVPRFGIPFTFADFRAGLASLIGDRLPDPAGFRTVLPRGSRFWTGSGRQAMWLLLKALRLKPGSGIALPLYSDLAVSSTVCDAGYTPVFVDVDPHTLTLDPASLARARDQASAVIVVHLFGQVAQLDTILDAAHGLPLIEDTVHAPLSYFRQRLAGSFGIGCFYSFGSTKCFPAGGGGMAVAGDPEVALEVREQARQLGPTTLGPRLCNLLLQTAKAAVFRRPLYGLLGAPLRPKVESRAFLEPVLDTKCIQPGQAAIALRQAACFHRRVERQRSNSHRLLTLLRDIEEVVLPWEPADARYNFHLFPVMLRDSAERRAVAERMLSRGVDTSTIYYNVVEHARRLGYAGGCPCSESAAQRVLTLPNSANLSDDDVHRVARVFREAVNTHRSRSASRHRVYLAPAGLENAYRALGRVAKGSGERNA